MIITRIITDNSIPEYIISLGISYTFWNTYINNIYPYKYNIKEV